MIREGKRISPVEVKSSAYNRHSSLDKLKAKFGKKIGDRYIIYTKDYKKEDGIIYLPVYMVLCNRQSCRKYVVCNQGCRYNYYIIDYKNAAADEKLYTEDLNYDIRRTD